MTFPIVGPVPPYTNPQIEPQFYKPRSYFISNITLGQTTTVTTTVENDYVIGQIVRLLIPPSSGCRQLNEQQGLVISILSTTQLVLKINSSQNVDAFISSSNPNQPQIVAVGDYNSGQINSNGRLNNLEYIPGSFINISPA